MRKAQAILEYAVVISCVVAALIAMQTYIKRGIQGRLREQADSIGRQYERGNTTADIILEANSRITTNTWTNQVDNVAQTTTRTSTDYDTEHRYGYETVN
jgi:hypothetical protein